jgi:hypothetical protein
MKRRTWYSFYVGTMRTEMAMLDLLGDLAWKVQSTSGLMAVWRWKGDLFCLIEESMRESNLINWKRHNFRMLFNHSEHFGWRIIIFVSETWIISYRLPQLWLASTICQTILISNIFKRACRQYVFLNRQNNNVMNGSVRPYTEKLYFVKMANIDSSAFVILTNVFSILTNLDSSKLRI